MRFPQMLAAITRFDEAELKEVHQHLLQFKAATSLKGDQAFLRALEGLFHNSIAQPNAAQTQVCRPMVPVRPIRIDVPRSVVYLEC